MTAHFPFSVRAVLPGVMSVLCLAAGCAGPTANAPASRESYRVVWTVRRAADNRSLAHVTSPPVRLDGGELRVRTDLQRAEENRPALPEFLAKVSSMRGSARVELITRATVLDAERNKKGKIKVHKRFIGALLPIRPGEKLGVNGPGDPLVVEVELRSTR